MNSISKPVGGSHLETCWGLVHMSNIVRSEEHTSELLSRPHLVCRLLLEKKNLVDQMQAAGLTWQAYCEAGCPREFDHFHYFVFHTDYRSPNVFMPSGVATLDLITAPHIS